MKLTIERNALLKATGVAQSIVERSNTNPILANVLIETGSDSASFRATDNSIEVIQNIDAGVDRAGAVTVGAHTLYDIARKLPAGSTVDISLDAGGGATQVKVEAGRSIFSLATMPREDFPIMSSADYTCSFELPAGDFRRLLEKTRFAMSADDSRPYLNGAFLHPVADEDSRVLRCVATDGHRLACVDAALPPGAEEMPGVILPRKTVGELCRILEGGDDALTVSVAESKIRFALADLVLTSALVEGTYPDYNRVIPRQNPRRLEVDKSDFAQAVDRVVTVCSDRDSQAVKLMIESDLLQLSLNAPDSGMAEEEVAAAYDSEPLAIGFNGRYLLEIANCIEQENMVLFLDSSNDQALVRDGNDDSSIFVVMPMRV